MLLSKSGHIKLSDFGLSEVRNSSAGRTIFSSKITKK